ncbi:DUF1499 domain-containing protein [Parvibaculum sp.]|uniref:DUF1499 domain-containing protein n=1 Tax=Parvibaculum sp. TaxID=2024848 RepID=UPI0027313733|nr:DUF1499 domain-containing protein [Parvibaculum sp.]MDP1626865.1 DUF1499 domain-containing protein [Parvibaculum sp.]MDP2148511.1 DUF1499 domain-containing protein [Parvibaculum sp.]MDP3329566.1 DUF1499 domain-containing protein [Parvibaculum sp.]
MMDRQRSRLAAWGLWIGIVALIVLALCILGNRFELVHFGIAVRGLALAALIGLIGAVVSAVGLVLALVTSRSGIRTAIAGLAVGLLVAAPVGQAIIAGSKLPRIHDISTDLDNPPAFGAVVAARGETSNPLDRAAPADLAEQQRTAYPDIATLTVAAQPGKVYEAALDTAREMGWEIVASTPETGTIEATATTRIMNFKDDIAIRVTEAGEGANVDVRSVSRVGESDLGANANRIRTYLYELKKNLAEAG